MKNFIVYSLDGTILRTGICDEKSVPNQARENEFAIISKANDILNYVLNGEVRSYTEAELAIKSNLPEGWIWKMPERIAVDTRAIADAQAQAWERIKQRRAEEELKPFLCDGALYDADRERISSAVTLAMLAQSAQQAFSIDWTLADNSVKTLDATGMISVGAALGARVSAIFDTARVLRDQINACTDIPTLDTINWP